MRFSDIQNTDELLNFLENKRHSFYHHFTTVSTLEAILRSGNWRFSSGKSMNDLHEYEAKSALGIKERIFSTCFSWGDEDNMAMWAMYCIPWEEAVRISIPRPAMLAWLDALKELVTQSPDYERTSLHDIFYYSENPGAAQNHFLWGRGKCRIFTERNGEDVSNSPRFTGYVKNSAWRQEQEARLTITLRHHPSRDFYDLPVSGEVFQSMKITFGPWCSKSQVKLFKARIANAVSDRSLRKTIASNIGRTSFHGLVKLKCHCDKCAGKFRRKKND